MLQTYKSKKEMSVLKWDGKKETLDFINEKICSLCKGLTTHIGYTENDYVNKERLFIKLKHGGSIGNWYDIGDYIVIDSYFINNGIPEYSHPVYGNPIKRFTEEELNQHYEADKK